MTTRPEAEQHLRDLALRRRVRDRIDCAIRDPAGTTSRVQELR